MIKEKKHMFAFVGDASLNDRLSKFVQRRGVSAYIRGLVERDLSRRENLKGKSCKK